MNTPTRIRHSIIIAVAICAAFATRSHALPAPCTHDRDWQALVTTHATRYPQMQIADVYKLLHQATMGSEHAAPSREAAQAWMTDELRTMGPGPNEPLIDTLGNSGRVVRVNLRPFISAGGNTAQLLDDFLKTAVQVRPDTSELHCALDAALMLVRNQHLHFELSAMTAFVSAQARLGYPATHHSEGFNATYKPAYRVIDRTFVASLVRQLKTNTNAPGTTRR